MESSTKWRFVIWLLALVVLVLYCITNLACLPSVEEIYLMELRDGSDDSLAVRVGYFGICAGSGKSFTCLSGINVTADSAVSHFMSKSTQFDSGNFAILVDAALAFKAYIVPLPLVAGIFFLFSVIPLAVTHLRSSQSKFIRRAALTCTWISVALSIAAAVGAHESASILQYFTKSLSTIPFSISAGQTLQGLQWAIVAISLPYALVEFSIFSFTSGKGSRYIFDGDNA